MKRSIFALACAFGTIMAVNGFADDLRQPLSVRPITFNYDYYLQDEAASPSDAAAAADEAPSVDEAVSDAPDAAYGNGHAASSCGCSSGGCDACGGCSSGCCGGCNDCCNGCDWCDLGDAWTLSDKLFCECSPYSVGGWLQFGYHNKDIGVDRFTGQRLFGSFNQHRDDVRLHQGWLYFEKALQADECSWDWGFRFDMLYGVDAQDTQAFGNSLNQFGAPQGWDNSWDNGIYGWAMPQAYVEVGNSDLSVKAGYFYTIIGYEAVQATGNFFYSHSITQYNTEPFTHTGLLAQKSFGDGGTLYAGWTLGWDAGFDQFGNGNVFLGGVSYELSDDVTATYATTIGDFGMRGDDGYMHSFVVDVKLTDRLQYVFQNDYLNVNNPGVGAAANPPLGPAFNKEDIFDLNNYLFYRINDCVTLGQRLEWWKRDGRSFYEATSGVNIRPHANVIFRPEVRWDWSPANNFDETTFAIDAILTF